jgi:hypothetical protein
MPGRRDASPLQPAPEHRCDPEYKLKPTRTNRAKAANNSGDYAARDQRLDPAIQVIAVMIASVTT